MTYQHTQHGKLDDLLLIAAGLSLLGAWLSREDLTVVLLVLAIGGVFAGVALMFGTLTVRDDGDALALRYGPLPVFRKRVRYAEITSVEPDRTKLIDGWGIHYIPGRGWTYNLWGFDCVRLTLGPKVVRIGSDDVVRLAAFLRARTVRPEDADAAL